VVHGFIKPRSLAQLSTTQMKNVKGYPLDLMSVIDSHVDDGGCVSFVSFVRPKQSTGAPWPLA
jgi:hypothetical protein